jgi:hypothetical protein
MQLVVRCCVGVLHCDPRTEFDVFLNGLAERVIVGKVRRVKSCHVKLDEPLSLFLGDPKSPMASIRCAKPSSRVK